MEDKINILPMAGNNDTAALMAPMQNELQRLEWQMQQFINTYGGKPASASANG